MLSISILLTHFPFIITKFSKQMRKHLLPQLQLILPSLKSFAEESESLTNALVKSLSSLDALRQNFVKTDLTPFHEYPVIDVNLLRKIFGIINIQLPNCIKHQDISMEFWKFYVSMEYGEMVPGERINRGNRENYLCVILQGTVDLQFGNNFDLFKSTANSKRHARKRNNRISHFSGLNQNCSSPVAEINTCYNIRAVTTGCFLKFPKKNYENFIEWIKSQEMQSLISFLSINLDISQQDVKLYRIHRKIVTKELFQGEKLDFRDHKNKNLYLILKGELLIEYKRRKTVGNLGTRYSTEQISECEDQSCSMFVSKGAHINNTNSKVFQNKIQYCQGLATKEATLIVFSENLLQDLTDNNLDLAGKLKTHCKKVENNRLNFLAKETTNKRVFQRSLYVLTSESLKRSTIRKKCPQSGKVRSRETAIPTQPSEVDFESFKKGINLIPRQEQRFCRKQMKNSSLPIKYEEFISDYPYRIIAQSQERVYKIKSLRDAKKRSSVQNKGSYLNQSKIKQKKQNQKVLRLRLKNMADKTIPNNTRFKGHVNDTKYCLKKGLFDQQNEEISSQQQPSKETTTATALAINDTGLIHDYIKGSKRYKKELSSMLKVREKKSRHFVDNKENSRQPANLFSHKTIKTMIRNANSRVNTYVFEEEKPKAIFYNRFITHTDEDFQLTFCQMKQTKKCREKTIMRRASSGKTMKVKLRNKK